jgi:GH25 family lysozyme M1 (1,4-beta-N-acetylmuramidase)
VYRKVARAGIRFVYVKATQGTTIVDPYFAEHSNRAKAQGIAIGAYHFFDYTTDGKAQADFFVDTVMSETGFDGTLPPVIDVECLLSYGRADQDFAIAQIRAFLGETYVRTGRMPMIYTSQLMWTRITRNDPGFAKYPLWVACWTCDTPFMPAGWTTWQFWQTGSTRIVGIDKPLDADIFNGADEDIAPLKGAMKPIATVNDQYVPIARPRLDLSGRDGVAYHYSVDGRTWMAWQAYSPASPVVTLSLGRDGPKSVLVQLRDPQGNLSPISTQNVIVDTVAPVLKPFTTSLPLGPMVDATGFMSVGVRWAVSDATSGLAIARVTGACGSASPAILQSVDDAHAGPQSFSLALRAGNGCTFSATAGDRAGHVSKSSEPTSFSIALAQEANGNVSWGGKWRRTNNEHMSEGKSRYSSAAGAAVTYRFRGTDIALIATTSPSRGRARVSIDGQPAGIIDQYSPTVAYRQRVFTAHLPQGEHKVTIQVLGTHNANSKGSRVDIDAFQVLVPGGSLASYSRPCGGPSRPPVI